MKKRKKGRKGEKETEGRRKYGSKGRKKGWNEGRKKRSKEAKEERKQGRRRHIG